MSCQTAWDLAAAVAAYQLGKGRLQLAIEHVPVPIRHPEGKGRIPDGTIINVLMIMRGRSVTGFVLASTTLAFYLLPS